jgi:hypothetical protein
MKNNCSKTLRELSVIVHNKAAREIVCAMADVGLLLRENGSDQIEKTQVNFVLAAYPAWD